MPIGKSKCYDAQVNLVEPRARPRRPRAALQLLLVVFGAAMGVLMSACDNGETSPVADAGSTGPTIAPVPSVASTAPLGFALPEAPSDPVFAGVLRESLVTPVLPRIQEESLWCWAAVVQVLTEYYAWSPGVLQCTQASAVLAGSTAAPVPRAGTVSTSGVVPPLSSAVPSATDPLMRCCLCPRPLPDDCNTGAWPNFLRWSHGFTRDHGCLPSWPDLTSELKGDGEFNGPFAFTKRDAGGSAHIYVMAGYAVADQNLILLHDPVGGMAWKDYEYWRNGTDRFKIETLYHHITIKDRSEREGNLTCGG